LPTRSGIAAQPTPPQERSGAQAQAAKAVPVSLQLWVPCAPPSQTQGAVCPEEQAAMGWQWPAPQTSPSLQSELELHGAQPLKVSAAPAIKTQTNFISGAPGGAPALNQ